MVMPRLKKTIDNADSQSVFAILPDGQGDGVPMVVLAVTEGAWEHICDGKTNHFDFTRAGLPMKLVVFGAVDRASAIKTIEACVGKAVNVSDQHFGIVGFPNDPDAAMKSRN